MAPPPAAKMSRLERALKFDMPRRISNTRLRNFYPSGAQALPGWRMTADGKALHKLRNQIKVELGKSTD